MDELILACLCAFAFFSLITLFLRFFLTSSPPPSISPDGGGVGGSSRSASVKGLDPEEIRTLPVYAYSAFRDLEIGKGSRAECPVCLGEFGEHESVRLLPKCDHAFHPKCIESWLVGSGTCPVCRTDLTADDEITA
uniref:RING-type E3 ubiquitin transferase n=1 Tax=Kalanchoe fedtschenkoi TaxID=63787 RepID=A0A7N0TXC8_KALFE